MLRGPGRRGRSSEFATLNCEKSQVELRIQEVGREQNAGAVGRQAILNSNRQIRAESERTEELPSGIFSVAEAARETSLAVARHRSMAVAVR